MILYFSGTGNSLAISRYIAEKLNETVMPLSQAVHHDLSQEKRIGLVYPSYWFNAPRAVTEILPRLQLPKEAYVFIVIPCGAQAGNSIHTVQKQLADGKSRCGDNCTQCLACVHFCPQQAVELNHKPTPKAHQYHHPKVTAKDMRHTTR